MTTFIAVKQIVDMLYQYQILDYGMVLFAIALILCKFLHRKRDNCILVQLCFADLLLIILYVSYSISFIEDFSMRGTYFKSISAILLYFVGRLYGDKVVQKSSVVAIVGYIVVYSNLVKRFFQFGCKLFLHGPEATYLNSGGFYYYKTDYAVGILTALLFIYLFSKVKILKWFTILPVGSYMIFYSGARSVKVVFALFYIYLLVQEISIRKNKKPEVKKIHFILWSIVLLGCLLLCFILIQVVPWEQGRISITENENLANRFENLFHSRHIVIMDILEYFSRQPFHTRFFGIDLGTDWVHTSNGTSAHSVYIRMLYSTGYLGCVTIAFFILCVIKRWYQTASRELRLCVFSFWTVVLFVGLSVETLQMTQMSWYAMIFAGALVTETNGASNSKADILLDKVYRKIHHLFWQKLKPGKWSYYLYPSYRHYRKCSKKQLDLLNSYNKENLYLTQKPNKGAGIGHQMGNWNCGYYYAGYFGVRYAYSSFASESWDSFLGFGENEIKATELLSNGYQKRRLPYFDENDKDSLDLIQRIIDSYVGKKVVFFLELDQFYAEQYGVREHISKKFDQALARKKDSVIYTKDCLNIAVHIRRGDIVIGQDTNDSALTKRWVNIEYYVNGMNQLSMILDDLRKKYQFFIFSQGKEEDFPELEGIKNKTYCLYMGAKDSFLHMVKADVLMTSKSSFSYKPALLSKGIKIVPQDFWHGYPNEDNWLVVNSSGELTKEQLLYLTSTFEKE